MTATPSNADATGPGDPPSRPAVLLVDDRPENLLALEAALESLGLDIVSASSPALALRLVREHEFAVIVLDVQMPGMDGYEVARRIKALGRPHLTPIIFVTALDRDRRHVHTGYESGAVDYLFKPLDPDELRAKVQAFARLHEEREAEARRQRRRYADLVEAAESAREAAALEAGQRAAELLERIGDAYLALDREFRIVGANPAAERMLARSRDELLGQSHWDVFPASATNEAGHAYRRVAAERIEQHVTQHYASEGYDLHVEIDAYPAEEGGVAIFLRDVTERVRAEAALRESEARYRTLFESIDAGFCVLDMILDGAGRPVDYRFVETNPSFVKQTGLENAIGRTAKELVPGLEAHWVETYGRIAATGEPERFQSGSEAMGRWFDVFAFRVGLPDLRRVALLFTDVTAARSAERERERLVAELQSANAELRRLTDEARAGERRARFQAELGVALQPLTDPDAVIATAARMLGEHLGADRCAYAEVEADEDHFTITGNYVRGDTPGIEGRWAMSAFGADALRTMREHRPWVVDDMTTDPRVAAADRPAYEQAGIRAVISVPLHKDGRFVAGTGIHQRTPRQWTPEEVELATTVTQRCWESLERARALRELRDREASLEAATAELADRTIIAEAAQRAAEEANRVKSEFLAVMSHELRTPLNAIAGYAQLIELGVHGPVTPEQLHGLERIQRSQRHLLGLINDVLNFAKLEAGHVEYDLAPVPLRTVVDALEPLVAPQLEAKRLRFERGACADDVVVRADPDKLRQILVNLLSNAVKFTEAGGTVAIRCEAAHGAAGRGDTVRVIVSDTGIGIPADRFEQIFAPFVQVERRLNAPQEGTGLGLAISRDLARGMGGELTVESTIGAGSAFTVTLPRA